MLLLDGQELIQVLKVTVAEKKTSEPNSLFKT
jgi:hypothetical protein